MKPPIFFTKVISNKRYSVSNATLIAGDDYYLRGRGYERCGQNHFLYRTPKGAYFLVTLSRRKDERTLRPISTEEAVELYETLYNHRLSYETAFPDVTVEDA